METKDIQKVRYRNTRIEAFDGFNWYEIQSEQLVEYCQQLQQENERMDKYIIVLQEQILEQAVHISDYDELKEKNRKLKTLLSEVDWLTLMEFTKGTDLCQVVDRLRKVTEFNTFEL